MISKENCGEEVIPRKLDQIEDILSNELEADVIISAAYDFVDEMVPVADKSENGAPLWYGWALRRAFERGAAFVLNNKTPEI